MCKYGMRYKPYRGKEGEKNQQPVKRNKNYLTTSKTGCPAKIYINEISVYTDYKVIGLTMKERQQKLESLKKDVMEKPFELKIDKFFHMRLPLRAAHEGHVVSLYLAKAGKTHPSILKKCQELTLNGITSTKIQKVILKKYAEDIVLKGNTEEVINENYYFPSEKVISNKIRSVIFKTRDTNKHQCELLQAMKSLRKKNNRKSKQQIKN
ncbi:hypothetical protein SK128_025246 [Halocaridina rubra]|uniref:Uncharacterized protein n=1 Tax=Halocaridina rubra TaxID=373956 RepID=A0AAN9A137_HALRR